MSSGRVSGRMCPSTAKIPFLPSPAPGIDKVRCLHHSPSTLPPSSAPAVSLARHRLPFSVPATCAHGGTGRHGDLGGDVMSLLD